MVKILPSSLLAFLFNEKTIAGNIDDTINRPVSKKLPTTSTSKDNIKIESDNLAENVKKELMRVLASSEGSELVGLRQGGTIQNVLDKVITLDAFKIKTDGTDQVLKLQQAISYLETLPGYWVLDGYGKIVTISNGLKLDIKKVGIRNVVLEYVNSINDKLMKPIFILDVDGGADMPPSAYNKPELKNIHICGPRNRDLTPVYAYKFNPSVNVANIIVDNCSAKNVNSAIVFGSNAYLITFENFSASGFNVGITDTLSVGLEKSISNAGENIRFNGGVFANSTSVMRLEGLVATFNFYSTSFDYTGDNETVSNIQFLLKTGGTSLNMVNCHFESGNENSGVIGNYFVAENSISVNIYGGWIVFGNIKYNKIPYFFYDKTLGKASFALEGCRVWGMGIRTWSNISPDKFLPVINHDTSMSSSIISDKNPWLIDPTFVDNKILDAWYAGGERESRLVSDSVLLKKEILNISGAEINALKITKRKSGGKSLAALIAQVPNNSFKPSISFKVCSAINVVFSEEMVITLSVIKNSFLTDEYGISEVAKKIIVGSGKIKKIGTNFKEIVVNHQLSRDMACLGFDHILIEIDLDVLDGSDIDSIFITDIKIHKPF